MIYTAHLLRPLHDELLGLLEGLSPEEWLRPTVAGRWRVRDVVAHLVDTDLRRISAQRLSPAVLLEMARESGRACADVVESVDPMGSAVHPVSWAGEAESRAWMDIGREYTEKWHHQQQIRDAVGAPLLLGPEWARPLFALSVKALPRAYGNVAAPAGAAVQVVIEGPGGGAWVVTRDGSPWALREGALETADTTVHLSTDEAWRIFYNALPPERRSEIRVSGDERLAEPLFAARSVIV